MSPFKNVEQGDYLYTTKYLSMTNNDILKKIRIALSLRDEDMLHILSLADFKITKGALNDLFRHEDHPGFVEAGDQVLRNFLNGLIIYKRGPLETSKNK